MLITTFLPPAPSLATAVSAFDVAPAFISTLPETVYIVPPFSVVVPSVIVPVSIAIAPPAAISAMTRIIEWFFMCFSLSL